jgi:hypothetical protein
VSWVFEDITLSEEEIEFIVIKIKYIQDLMSKMIKH